MNIIGNLDKIFAGGSDDRTKTKKWFGALQAETTPEGALNRINNLITTGWKNETQTDYLYVMKPLLESGIIDAAYPEFWSKDSQYNLASMTWRPGGDTKLYKLAERLGVTNTSEFFRDVQKYDKLLRNYNAYEGPDNVGSFQDTVEYNQFVRQMQEKYPGFNRYAGRTISGAGSMAGLDQDVVNKLHYGWDSKNDAQWQSLLQTDTAPAGGWSYLRGGRWASGTNSKVINDVLRDTRTWREQQQFEGPDPDYKPDHNGIALRLLGLTQPGQLKAALGGTAARWGHQSPITPEQQANRDLLESYGISINVKTTEDEGWYDSTINLRVPGLQDFVNNNGAGGGASLAKIFDAAGMSDQSAVVNHYLSQTNGGGEQGKRTHFTNIYNTIKDSGYTGDLTKLEIYLGV